ncbi:hypothetical protein GGD54_005400 [Rhizobium tropici]|uniref:Uncharacterized protein n=2 Tax=Rhizobium TaxID=379 RepID=A0A1C3X692_9HYPH|nr:hypothetical protein [Rhizobium tropici]MBB6305402.1 hypothetical protein [Rhizobium leucaenae]MBB6488563.1 hypothetical protein [Rhizobium lusitanum]MBB5595963.1 hypothetical protein [Rhizobium tropici]MBB6494966.1 hypothetical protein [Rhizobium tropici]
MKGDFPLTISLKRLFAKTISRSNINVGSLDRGRAVVGVVKGVPRLCKGATCSFITLASITRSRSRYSAAGSGCVLVRLAAGFFAAGSGR